MRKVKRWVAECDFVDETGTCPFNEREKPRLHKTVEGAQREAETHAREQGHIGARQVTVERTYKLESEEIVSS